LSLRRLESLWNSTINNAILNIMMPEQEHRGQDPISLEEVISNAKEIMLRDGQHVPTLIMEAGNNLIVGQIPYMPATHEKRMDLMQFLGESAAESGRVNQLRQVFMVSEGWMSMAKENKQAEFRPSQDPERKEVLIISSIQIKEHNKQLKLFEILRDSDEQVVDLKEIIPDQGKKEDLVEIPLLDAFVQGFQLAFRTKFN